MPVPRLATGGAGKDRVMAQNIGRRAGVASGGASGSPEEARRRALTRAGWVFLVAALITSLTNLWLSGTLDVFWSFIAGAAPWVFLGLGIVCMSVADPWD